MIACPHCNQHVKPAANGAAFDCPMCGDRIDPSVKGSATKKIALGVGVAVAIAVGAYVILRDDDPVEKFQPAYGTPVASDVNF